MTHTELKKETHKRLSRLKIEWGLKSLDEVVAKLLDHEEGKP